VSYLFLIEIVIQTKVSS